MGHRIEKGKAREGESNSKREDKKDETDNPGEDMSGWEEAQVDLPPLSDTSPDSEEPKQSLGAEASKKDKILQRGWVKADTDVKADANIKAEAGKPEHGNKEEKEGSGKTREKKRPQHVTILPFARDLRPCQPYVSPTARAVITAAESYISWYEQHPQCKLLSTSPTSEAQFDAIIKYLDSTGFAPSIVSPKTARQPSSPSSPRTPSPQISPNPLSSSAGLNSELKDVYAACQRYIDDYIDTYPPSHTTTAVLSNLHIDILLWRNEFIALAHGNEYLNSLQNRNANKLLHTLLERMFQGITKHHPWLKKNVSLVDGEVVGTEQELGVEGFEVIKDSVTSWTKKFLPDSILDTLTDTIELPDMQENSWSWMKIGAVGLFVIAFWVSVFSLLAFWTPIAWQHVSSNTPHLHHSLHHTPPQSTGIHIPFLNINIPSPSYLFSSSTRTTPFQTQLQTFESNLATVEKYYQEASSHASSGVHEILSKTEQLVKDLRHIAFVKFWKGIPVVRPVLWLLGGDTNHPRGMEPEEGGRHAVKRLVKGYFEGVETVRRKMEGEKRALSDALGKLERKFQVLVKAAGGASSASSTWNPFRPRSQSHSHQHLNLQLPKSLDEVKRRYEKQGKLAKEHLFVLYDELDGFVGKVKAEIDRGDAKGWWLAVGEVRKVCHAFKERVKELAEVVKESVEKVVWEDREREEVVEERD